MAAQGGAVHTLKTPYKPLRSKLRMSSKALPTATGAAARRSSKHAVAATTEGFEDMSLWERRGIRPIEVNIETANRRFSLLATPPQAPSLLTSDPMCDQEKLAAVAPRTDSSTEFKIVSEGLDGLAIMDPASPARRVSFADTVGDDTTHRLNVVIEREGEEPSTSDGHLRVDQDAPKTDSGVGEELATAALQVSMEVAGAVGNVEVLERAPRVIIDDRAVCYSCF
mmetsp:Transcript_37428/g.99751  ORF Transcript_37428/g.99751 Transcript_37428/m.99751 type:complete len:225 (-) Transcript_37428:131-805(-)